MHWRGVALGTERRTVGGWARGPYHLDVGEMSLN